MAGTGPAPSPNARRRNTRPAFRQLPAGGRVGDPPAWPIPGRHTKAELQLWVELWATPQATAWETLGWTRTVARYARIAILAETARGVTDTLRGKALTEARLLEIELGLTPTAMKKLGWEITAADAQESADDADVVDIDAFRARVG